MPFSFLEPSSRFNPSFWEELYQRQLHSYGLITTPKQITSKRSLELRYECCYFSKESFDDSAEANNATLNIQGNLQLFNNIDEFKSSNKQDVINRESSHILHSILHGHFLDDPWSIFRFILISFADLKHYNFSYWLALPTFLPATGHFSYKHLKLLDNEDHYSKEILQIISRNSERLLSSRTAHQFSGCYNGELKTLREIWPLRYDPGAIMFTTIPCSILNESEVITSWSFRNFLFALAVYSSVDPKSTSWVMSRDELIPARSTSASPQTDPINKTSQCSPLTYPEKKEDNSINLVIINDGSLVR